MLEVPAASCEQHVDEPRLIAVDCRCKGHDVGGELQVINPTSNASAIGSSHINNQCRPLTRHPCVSGVPGSLGDGIGRSPIVAIKSQCRARAICSYQRPSQ
jgi:hypothetical protein